MNFPHQLIGATSGALFGLSIGSIGLNPPIANTYSSVMATIGSVGLTYISSPAESSATHEKSFLTACGLTSLTLIPNFFNLFPENLTNFQGKIHEALSIVGEGITSLGITLAASSYAKDSSNSPALKIAYTAIPILFDEGIYQLKEARILGSNLTYTPSRTFMHAKTFATSIFLQTNW